MLFEQLRHDRLHFLIISILNFTPQQFKQSDSHLFPQTSLIQTHLRSFSTSNLPSFTLWLLFTHNDLWYFFLFLFLFLPIYLSALFYHNFLFNDGKRRIILNFREIIGNFISFFDCKLKMMDIVSLFPFFGSIDVEVTVDRILSDLFTFQEGSKLV